MATKTSAKQTRRMIADELANCQDPADRAALKAELDAVQTSITGKPATPPVVADPAAGLAATLARNSRPGATKSVEVPETDLAARNGKPEVKPRLPEVPTPVVPVPTPPASKCKPCTCGCGFMTKGGRFIPGHDARLYGRIKRSLEGRLTTTDLSPEAIAAVENAIANGELPHGNTSFAVQDHKSPAAGEQTQNDRKAERVRARIVKLENDLAAAKAELVALGHTTEEATSPSDHEEIVQAMVKEGTA